MKRALLIAEKPSLMRDIQTVYLAHRSEIPYTIDFMAQRGHLLTLMLPDELDEKMKVHSWDNLPFFPEEHGGWKYKIIEEKKTGRYQTAAERFTAIEKQLKTGSYDFVIHAGDPDQEGELLVNIVLRYLGNTLPVARFWTNDLTEGHILHALQKLRNDNTDALLTNLMAAAYVRQHSDYLFGMNISRGASQQMHGRAACGRVKTFIQACVVEREDAIASFTSSSVYGVKVNYAEGFSGALFKAGTDKETDKEDDENTAGLIWFDTKKEAEDLIQTLSMHAKVVSYEKKETKTYAPKLFKLSSAQMVAGKRGFNPDQTLDIIQNLYDKYKVMSYPRTSCEFMGSDEDFAGILHTLYHVKELAPFIRTITKEDIERVLSSRKWVNDKELETKGHSALRPTTIVPDFSKMTNGEKEIYLMIARRFVAMFLKPWVQDTMNLVTDIDGCTFRSSGKVTVDKGYLDIFNQKPEDSFVPAKKAGDELAVKDYEVSEKAARCPSHFTQADLIAICENPAKYLDDQSLKKLGKRLIVGTEATRAGIIRQLIDKDQYLEEFKVGRKEYVRATPTGTAIIRNLQGLMITKPDLTGTWEVGLEAVREGKRPAADLEEQIRKDMVAMLEEIHGKSMGNIRNLGTYLKAPCPFCGRPVVSNEWGWLCSGHKNNDPSSCQFGLRKIFSGCQLKEKDIEDLCRKGRTSVKTFVSRKTGQKFRAYIEVKEDKTLGFAFPSNETKMKCPKCGEPLIKGKNGYHCRNYHNGCDFAVWNQIAGRKIADKDLKVLLTDGLTDWIKDFKKKDGSKFSAKLKLQDGKVVFSFEHTPEEIAQKEEKKKKRAAEKAEKERQKQEQEKAEETENTDDQKTSGETS